MDASFLVDRDPDRLHYWIESVHNGQRTPVYFAPLTAEDEDELRGARWHQAVFRDVWPDLIDDTRTRKLVCTDNGAIQGIVRPGPVLRSGGYLQKSLLEVAPDNRLGPGPRTYHGVGKMLVVRLVIQSLQEGGAGKLLVTPRPGTEGFYLHLGFKQAQTYRNLYLLEEPEARLLATLVTGAKDETE